MHLCAGYVRVSTEEQREGASPEDQRQKIKQFARSKGWTVTKIFEDLGVSGTEENRPGLNDLLDGAKAGEFKAVICSAIDRLARDNLILGTLLRRKFPELGIKAFFTKEGEAVSEQGWTGEMMANIFGTFAQAEFGLLQERMKAGKAVRVGEGKWPFATHTCPYGYKRDPDKKELVPVEEEIKILKRMVDMVLKKKTLTQIARTLDAEGVPTKRGGKWHPMIVKRIVKNKIYSGEPYKLPSYPDKDPITLPRLLDPVRQERAIAIIEKNEFRAPRKKDAVFLGFVYCGYCGKRLTPKRVQPTQRKTQEYYVCSGKIRNPKSCPKSVYMPLVKLDRMLWSQIWAEMLLDPKRYLEKLEPVDGERSEQRLKSEVAKLNREIKGINKKIERIVRRSISMEDDDVFKEVMQDEGAKLRKRREEWIRQRNMGVNELGQVAEQVKKWEALKKDLDEMEELARQIGAKWYSDTFTVGR
ncbi:MAG: recombinase family protein [Thermodesulfobacteriota bacterium]